MGGGAPETGRSGGRREGWWAPEVGGGRGDVGVGNVPGDSFAAGGAACSHPEPGAGRYRSGGTGFRVGVMGASPHGRSGVPSLAGRRGRGAPGSRGAGKPGADRETEKGSAAAPVRSGDHGAARRSRYPGAGVGGSADGPGQCVTRGGPTRIPVPRYPFQARRRDRKYAPACRGGRPERRRGRGAAEAAGIRGVRRVRTGGRRSARGCPKRRTAASTSAAVRPSAALSPEFPFAAVPSCRRQDSARRGPNRRLPGKCGWGKEMGVSGAASPTRIPR